MGTRRGIQGTPICFFFFRILLTSTTTTAMPPPEPFCAEHQKRAQNSAFLVFGTFPPFETCLDPPPTSPHPSLILITTNPSQNSTFLPFQDTSKTPIWRV